MRLAFIFFCAASIAYGRIGETALQFAERYGPPKDTPASQATDKVFPLVEGAIHHTYEYQGWKIRAAFLELDGPAVRMEFQKIITAGVNATVQDYEVQAIMNGNTPSGMSWTPTAYDNPDSPNKGLAKMMEGMFAVGQKMWRRTDGAICWLRGPLIVRLDLPAARQRSTAKSNQGEEGSRVRSAFLDLIHLAETAATDGCGIEVRTDPQFDSGLFPKEKAVAAGDRLSFERVFPGRPALLLLPVRLGPAVWLRP